jgi:3-deoxy-D-manno-octulosonic-acid transferase
MLLLDLLYLLALFMLSPWLVWRSVWTGRYRSHLAAKLIGSVQIANPRKKSVAWFHAVSVGEVNLLATVVPAFRQRHPDWLIVISATTDTGLAAARQQFAELTVIAWPFDFSWAVAAALEAVKPALIILTESELWPNFLHAAQRRRIPTIVVNARLSPRSFARLHRIAGLAQRWLFANVTGFAVQEQEYADRLRQLGVPREKLELTGSVKYDGALKERNTPAAATLRHLLAMDRLRVTASSAMPLVWLAGSTHAPEEAIVLEVFGRLRTQFPHLHLLLVPRHPDRFEEVARLVERTGHSFARRSRITSPRARHGLGLGRSWIHGRQFGWKARRTKHDRARGLRRAVRLRTAHLEFQGCRQTIGGGRRSDSGFRCSRAGDCARETAERCRIAQADGFRRTRTGPASTRSPGAYP